jgi:predicted nucleic acid-binding protein
MVKVFLDASVIFSAIYSPTGASREILKRAFSGLPEIVVSRFVLEEVARNLAEKVPEKVGTFHIFLALLDPEIVADPTKEEVLAAAEYTALKDAPVVAAAIKAETDYLVTLDRKHLIDPPEVAQKSGLDIVLPGVALEVIRGEQQDRLD